MAHSCSTSPKACPSITGTSVVACLIESIASSSPSYRPTARASRTPVTAIASARGPQELTRLRAAATSPDVPMRTSRNLRSRKVTRAS
jgi:hypothetical protein